MGVVNSDIAKLIMIISLLLVGLVNYSIDALWEYIANYFY